jgi:hypothetical protein
MFLAVVNAESGMRMFPVIGGELCELSELSRGVGYISTEDENRDEKHIPFLGE